MFKLLPFFSRAISLPHISKITSADCHFFRFLVKFFSTQPWAAPFWKNQQNFFFRGVGNAKTEQKSFEKISPQNSLQAKNFVI